MAAKKELSPVEDQRKRLVELRDKLDVALKSCSENMLPQLAGQYRATLADLATLPAVKVGPVSKRDELKERRERKQVTSAPRRRAAAAAAPAAGAKGRQRRT